MMTLGCEAGVFEANFAGADAPTVYIGAYVNIAFRDPSDGGEENVAALARFIAYESKFKPGDWTQLEIGIEPMRVFFGHFGLFCLELKFVDYGKDEIMAWRVFDSAARRVTNVIPQFNISLGPEKHLR
ncbi:hypothetical protein PQR66_24280 [Paraburkholderia agricolaris]|uniref:Uncharacterized protein n=1 Tax=Paraburkholderia agricolaris TaxID=2152888 RepID=A0ABW8ZTL3_9BURK